MNYQIYCEPMPVVICNLNPEETLISEAGAMSWMSPNMEMKTVGGGAGKMLGRMFSGESMFQNHYTAKNGPGMIAFASSFPGSIRAYEITPDHPIICQKKSFLASTTGVSLSVYMQKKLTAGFFGGEGFVMQQLSGSGIAFAEIDGELIEYELKAGQQMIIDTGYVAGFQDTVSIDIQQVKGMKNKLLGGEGFFNTVLTGPGRIWLQTMPIPGVAGAIQPYIVTAS